MSETANQETSQAAESGHFTAAMEGTRHGLEEAKKLNEDTVGELDKLLNEARPNDNLDNLLERRFPKEEPDTEVESQVDQDAWASLQGTQDQLEQIGLSLQIKEEQRAISTAAKQLAQDNNISEDMAERFLRGSASKDPSILPAFKNRDIDPRAWNRAVGGVDKSLREAIENLPDPALTEDREAVMASAKPVNVAETDGPSDREISGMSTREFNKLLLQHGVKPYGSQ